MALARMIMGPSRPGATVTSSLRLKAFNESKRGSYHITDVETRWTNKALIDVNKWEGGDSGPATNIAADGKSVLKGDSPA